MKVLKHSRLERKGTAGGSRGESLRSDAGGEAPGAGSGRWVSLHPPPPQPLLPQGSPSRTCMISHRPSAPARVPVLGIILCQCEKRKAVIPCRKEDGRVASEPSPFGTSYNPDGCSHPGRLTPSGTGGCGGCGGRVRRCWGARVVGCPHPPSRPWCVCVW